MAPVYQKISNNSSVDDYEDVKVPLERDFYGSYCLKFRIKHGSSVSEDQIFRDFGAYGELLDVWGAGFILKNKDPLNFNDRLDSEVYVRFHQRQHAKEALANLYEIYHELTPAISDVLPDNHGTYTIFFDNKMGISSKDLFHEFSKHGDVKSITGDLDRLMGRVFISFWKKEGAIKAFLNKTERWFVNMRFTLPRCEKDYFGTYCMKFYNTQGTATYASEEKVRRDFGRYGEIVDIRGPGLFHTSGNDVYVRYWEKTSAHIALSSLVGKYDSLSITPATDIHSDKYGMYTLTFINEQNVSEDEVWQIFQKFGHVVSVSGTFNTRTGRVFLNYEDKEAAVRAMQGMLISKQFHIRLARSCRPPKFQKSSYNYYSSVATEWNREELPRKRKGRNFETNRDERWQELEWGGFQEQDTDTDRKRHYARGDDDSVVDGRRTKRRYEASNNLKRINESGIGIENESGDSGQSYSYRAPYQDVPKDQEEVAQKIDSICEIQMTESFFQPPKNSLSL